MTKCPYVGVNETARRVRKLYIGVGGIARKVKRAYVGINNVARLFYTSEFFLPKGVNLSNVVAAYQFKAAKSQAEAMIDITGHGYNLSTPQNDVVWDQTNGIRAGTFVNNNLANLNKIGGVITHVIFYGNYRTYEEAMYVRNVPLSAMGMPALSLLNKNDYSAHGGGSEGWWDGDGQIGMMTYYDRGDETAGHWEGYGGLLATNTWAPASGVIGGTRTELWLNGNQVSTRNWGGNSWTSSKNPFEDINNGNRVVRPSNNPINKATVDIYAAVFFNIRLSAEQHSELSRSMMEIKL